MYYIFCVTSSTYFWAILMLQELFIFFIYFEKATYVWINIFWWYFIGIFFTSHWVVNFNWGMNLKSYLSKWLLHPKKGWHYLGSVDYPERELGSLKRLINTPNYMQNCVLLSAVCVCVYLQGPYQLLNSFSVNSSSFKSYP